MGGVGSNDALPPDGAHRDGLRHGNADQYLRPPPFSTSPGLPHSHPDGIRDMLFHAPNPPFPIRPFPNPGTSPVFTDSPGSRHATVDQRPVAMPPDPVLTSLRDRAQRLTTRAHVPFSETPTAAVLLLDDGRWIPGVRVESASYALTLPALLNAYTTAMAAGGGDAVAAAVLSRPFRREEALYVEELPQKTERFRPCGDDAWVCGGGTGDGALPTVGDPLSPELDEHIDDAAAGIDVARRVATRAYVPASDYAVGAVLDCGDGRLVPGVNVEHPDWARILCAERNALGTVQSYALPAPEHLFLTCNEDPHGTPCGACRQLLAELAPDTTLWMDRHRDAPERSTVSTLLPGSFRGQALIAEA